MKLTFFVRSKTIYARINSGKRGCAARVSTGIKAIGTFDVDRQRFTDRSEYAIRSNARLRDISNRFESLCAAGMSHEQLAAELIEKDTIVIPSKDKLMLCDFMSQKVLDIERGERSRMRKAYSTDSMLAFRSTYRSYKRFVTDTGKDIDLLEVDLYGKKDRMERKAAADKVHEVMQSLMDWFIEMEYKPNTQKHYINMINRFISMAEQEYMIEVQKEMLPMGEEFPIVTMPVGFVGRFAADTYGIYDSLPDRLKWVYEASVVILMTTFRIKDALALKSGDILIKGDGSTYIRHISSKRKKPLLVPIPSSFYQKLMDNQRRYGSIYTQPKDVKVSYYAFQSLAPQLFAMYDELKEDYSVQRMRPDQQGTYTVTQPLYKYITAHALRRTAITMMLLSGVPEMQVKFASGHEQDSASFKKYVDYVESVFSTKISAYQEQLLSSAQYVPEEECSSEITLSPFLLETHPLPLLKELHQ